MVGGAAGRVLSMPKGGKRPGSGRPRIWRTGVADVAIKVPAALADRVMAYARQLDEESPIGDTAIAKAGEGEHGHEEVQE